MVCEECKEKFRSAARLRTSYSTGTAVRELVLMILAGFSLLLLWSNVISLLHVSLVVGTTGITFLAPVVVLFSGLKIARVEVGDRYGLTHNLGWSLHSRHAMIGLAMILSSILVIIFQTAYH